MCATRFWPPWSGWSPTSASSRRRPHTGASRRQRLVLRVVLLLVAADAVHEVVQVAGGELPAERPCGLVVPVHEAQQGGGELSEAGEVVGGDDFLLDDGEEDLGSGSARTRAPGCGS